MDNVTLQNVDKLLPIKVLIIRLMYGLTLNRLKRKYGKGKIKVGFLVSEISKWKGQSLYDYLANSQDFEPFIYVFPCSRDLEISSNHLEKVISDKIEYFQASGIAVGSIWDIDRNKCIPVSEIDVDIVFYQQTWDIPIAPSAREFAPKALTFYFPYYMVNNYIPSLETGLYLHHYVFRYILLNEAQVKLYRPFYSPFLFAGKMVGLGHPCVDLFFLKRDYQPTKNYVIYAPHFSFKCNRKEERPFYSSTFLQQGKLILDFAKNHPEINWVFKPHPRLRSELTFTDVWTPEEVDQYYQEWEKIGIACYDSHYQELFLESKAMITDSGSFLSEYSCTGKPLIRLIPDEGKTMSPPNPVLANLYESFYKVYNDADLSEFLDLVVIRGLDPQREERMKLVREAGLADHYAAQSITEYIRTLLKK